MKKFAKPSVRSLLGFIFFASALAFFMMPPPELPPGDMLTFMSGLMVTKYFFYLLKGTELICGALLLTNFYAPLALIILSPIVVNIFCVHIFMEHSGIPTAIVIAILHLTLAYMYRDVYKPLFRKKN